MDHPYQENFFFVLAIPVVIYEIMDGLNLATLFPQDLFQERDNVQLRVVNYIFYRNGKATRKISNTNYSDHHWSPENFYIMVRCKVKFAQSEATPFFPIHGLRSKIFDEESFDEWVKQAEAPALPASVSLYKELQQLGFKLFLLTGRSEPSRNATVENLRVAGYDNWERLILRRPSDKGKLAIDFKSEKRKELEDEGYRIQGNSGDQWSDLLGYAISQRSFKLPNPIFDPEETLLVGPHRQTHAKRSTRLALTWASRSTPAQAIFSQGSGVKTAL
ncbi:hypothetical protein Cgig2_024051 [Carnegiea gigantea]|uniref:Uncharacterized protein n=1 Tax=Carnegiea gigantea TaxID=171969 RepID=A0A9Q1KJP2_9CARY|nr:hypothetical protein Cgig2_024051 [Carnegiea gigantea]